MADANILEALNSRGTLDSLILYGKVRCAIEKPNILGNTLEVSDVGAFAILDVFAIKCLEEDYFRGNSNGLYFSRGSMIIFINSLDWVGEIVKVSGAYARYGVKVKQQWNHKTAYDGITALAFQKVDGGFKVVPNHILKLGDHDADLNMTPLEDFVVKLKSDNIMEYPITLDSIIDYQGVDDYIEVSKEDIKDAKDTYVNSDGKIDVTKIDLKLTYHLEAQEESEYLEAIKEDISNMSKNRKKYAKNMYVSIKDGIRKDETDIEEISSSIRDAFVDRVLTKYSQNIGQSTIKGKTYANAFVSHLTGKPFEVEDGFTMPTQSEMNKSIETLNSMIQMSPEMLKNDSEDLNLPMLKDINNVALVIVSISTGISMDSLQSNYYSCTKLNGMCFKDWFYCLLNNPYIVGMMGSSLGVEGCDKIYFSYTRFFTDGIYIEECGSARSDLLYLKTMETADDKNTFILKKEFKSLKAAYPGLEKRFLIQNFFPCRKDLVELLSAICGRSVQLSPKELDTLDNITWYSEERTNELIDRGVVNSIDDYLALEKDIEKEVLIYETLIAKGRDLTGITEEQVSKTIEKFEDMRGFQLEHLQKEGIKLCMHKGAVLSGCAGSGKTTTSDCITMCLTEYLGDYDIIYGTPTGKACRRLAEVVGGNVKTLHSQFGVGMYGEGYFTEVKKKYEDWNNPSHCAYLLDEMAMCNTDLLYEVCRSIGKEDLIYFLGDCKQLPPIGKGNPFFLLMKLLPCVELGVSKRAAEGSQVNYNTTLVNCVSDDVVQELYYDEETFFCRECKDADIPRVVTDIWKRFMTGEMNGTKYEEDDIQVISGYATPEKTFSSTSLNTPIQQFLRRSDKLLFRNGERDFYKNDRTIHSRLNSYGTQRYIEVEDNVFKSVVTLGIMNGEVGKLVGITRTDFAQFEDFEESDLDTEDVLYGDLTEEEKEKLLKVREERQDKIRDDASFRNENYYYVKVKVYDTDLHRDVIVLYPARGYKQDEILVLGGEDLSNLDFAYALTTHKMQGSQSQVIILPFGSTCNPQFINRNMLNTMISRSQGIVCMIGDVKGIDSPVSKGRRIPSPLETKDMLSLLCE